MIFKMLDFVFDMAAGKKEELIFMPLWGMMGLIDWIY